MGRFFAYLWAHKVSTVFVILLALGGFYLATRPAPPPNYETALVTRGDIVQEVSVTGRVESEAEADLAFERGGRVATAPRSVGERVKAGDILVRLDASELSASRAQALANLDYEIAKLEELNKGTRPEEIAIAEARVDGAESGLSDAALALIDRSRVAFTTADNAVRNTIDAFFRNPRTIDPQLTVQLIDTKIEGELESGRGALEAILISWEKDTDTWYGGGIAPHAEKVSEDGLVAIQRYLDKLAYGVNALTPNSSVSQTSIDAWKASISSARVSIDTALSALLSSKEKYRAAEQALLVAQSELALKKAGVTPESLTAQAARVAASRATVESYDTQISKMVLTAPFSGVVTRQDAKRGEAVAPNIAVVTLMSDGAFRVSANIPEVDVAKVAVGDIARITLDAYGTDAPFSGVVSAIDPAETVIEGVPTYKVTLHFTEEDPRIRSGMTANIDIETDRRTGVLVVPSRAVTTREGIRSIRVLHEDGTVDERIITTGLRGSSGTQEILTGLSEGERIISFEERE